MWFLAGDIGGTNTRLRAEEWDNDRLIGMHEMNFASRDADSLLSIVQAFLTQYAIPKFSAACFAVAGPVHVDVARITNLPWIIKSDDLIQNLPIQHITLINDFSGVAHGIAQLTEKDLQTLQSATAAAKGTVLVLGAGTGLGMAIIDRGGDVDQILETEAGHVGFSPSDDEEFALMNYWRERVGRVSNETLLSGPGIVRIFEFYRMQASKPPSQALLTAMREEDPARAINTYAQKYKDPVALRSMRRFASIYASVAGDMALACKASGGVYLAGGIAATALAFLQTDHFLEVFNNKPPMQGLLTSIPVQVITNTSVGLLGAMAVAKQSVG